MDSKKDIETILSKIMHPEVNASLMELGMIGKADVKNNVISITLALPFLEIPIKDDLIKLVEDAFAKDKKIEIKTALMSEKERDRFMKTAREKWRF